MQNLDTPSRRSLLALAVAAPLAAVLERTQGPAKTPADEPRFCDPPGAMTPALRAQFEEARKALASDALSTNDLLADARWSPLRPYTEFRELIRDFAKQAKAILAPIDEPGERIVIALHAVDEAKKPCAKALVYAYNTDRRGWYAAEAPHVSGNEGDHRHARLFGYGRTNDKGVCELSTVRPGGYPRSDLPQHIHVVVTTSDGQGYGEILFDDDPRLTPKWRTDPSRAGWPVVELVRDGDVQLAEAQIVVHASEKR